MQHRGLLALGLVVFLMPALSAAQSVTGGAKAGVVFANIPDFGDVMEASTSMRTGLIAGGFLTWSTSGGFGVQPEALYVQKGVKLDEPGITASVELSYLDVPVLARYTFGKGTTRGFVFGGPSFNFKLDAKAKSSFEGQDEEEDIDEDVESFEFALVVGAGVEFGHFLVEGRFAEGLTNLVKDDEDMEETLKNRTFAILAGFRF
jgi:hypothetical protein